MDQTQTSDIRAPRKVVKLPTNGFLNSDVAVVGILDASGSMSSYWGFLANQYNKLIENHPAAYTITFDTSVRILDKPLITKNINEYGGGGTNITSCFYKFNERFLSGSIKQKNITVIFVSDGQDSQQASLKDRMERLRLDVAKTVSIDCIIHFICIAVGAGFPTFVAMGLREIYHSGEPNIPAVFLIDTSKDVGKDQTKEVLFQEQFELLAPYLGHNQQVQFKPPCYQFPWSTDSITQAYGGQWLLTNHDSLVCDLDGKQTEVFAIAEPNIFQVIEFSKGWVQAVQLLSLKTNPGPVAKQALEVMLQHRDRLANTKVDKKLTFAERLKMRGASNMIEDVNLLIREMRKYAESELLGKLSQEEASKRLAIGTVVGKYHSNAIKLKGISVDDYLKARSEFMEILQGKTIDLNNSSQEPSVISMQNQKDVLAEADIIEGLKMCPSQYDLVETLPLIGHGVLIKRIEGAMINPWLIQVKMVARHHKILDSIAIQQKGNEITLSLGNDESEKINCVLPLFTQVDKDLRPVLQSKLYHILMTFNVMMNADTCYETAYAALLANTLVFLICEPPSQWREELIELVFQTTQIVYLESRNFAKYQDVLLKTPNIGVVTEHPDINTKCEDPSKAILALFCSMKVQQLSKEQVQTIVDAIILEAISRMYPGDLELFELFQIANKDELKKLNFNEHVDSLIHEYPEHTLVQRFYTTQNLKDDLSGRILKLDLKKEVHFKIDLSEDKLFFLNNKYTLNNLNLISKFFCGTTLDKEKLICFLNHASKYRNSYLRQTTPVNYNYQEIIQQITNAKTSDILKSNKIFTETFEVLEKRYQNQMFKAHVLTLPMSEIDLEEFCVKNKLNKEVFKFNAVSNLFQNACLAPRCPYYMVMNPSLSNHISSYPFCPGFHKTIKLHYDLEAEQILQMILEGKCLVIDMNTHFGPKSLISALSIENIQNNKAEVLESIERSKKIYQKIK